MRRQLHSPLGRHRSRSPKTTRISTWPDIYSSVGYYLRHQAELDGDLARRQSAAEIFRDENRRLYPQGIRERLLSR